MGFLRRDRAKEIFINGEEEPEITFSSITWEKNGWLSYRDREKRVWINMAHVKMVIEHLTDDEKPL